VARHRRLASALYIVSGIVLFPRLGAVVTVGLFIAGQMLASVLLDSFAMLGVARQPFNATTA
jgi:transporter family-2 protein